MDFWNSCDAALDLRKNFFQSLFFRLSIFTSIIFRSESLPCMISIEIFS